VFHFDPDKGVPVGALAKQMHWQNGAYICAARPFQNRFDGCRIQVEGGGLDVGQHRGGAGAQNTAHRGKEAERGGHHGHSGADARRGQGQP
jgi:hypothetical protein